jgi:hypothetical protein
MRPSAVCCGTRQLCKSLGGEIVQNREVVRPKMFELLTPNISQPAAGFERRPSGLLGMTAKQHRFGDAGDCKIRSCGSSTGSSPVGVWQLASTKSRPTVLHSSNLPKYGYGCAQ